MATFYLDFEGGNDALDGTTFATRWKTITSGATAARLAPGDRINIAASPNPTLVGTATWAQNSKTVTLAAPVTATISDCETLWTASANVTCTADTSNFKENSRAMKAVIATGFTTGLAAYSVTGTLDLSGYQQVSFWVYVNTALAAGTLSLRLCSDAAGAVPVHTVPIPALPAANRWVPVTVDLATYLSAAIASAALYQDTDTTGLTVWLDNIIACKAASAPDALTLTSLIGKEANLPVEASTAYAAGAVRRMGSGTASNGLRYQATTGGTTGATTPALVAWPTDVGASLADGSVVWTCLGPEETWYPIQSINGTSVKIDNDVTTLGNAGRGYSGNTETVATYRRETIKLAMPSSLGAVVNAFQVSGADGKQILFVGGYNSSTDRNADETWLDGQNGMGVALHANGKSFIQLANLHGTRFYNGLAEVADGWSLARCQWTGCSNAGLTVFSSVPNLTGFGVTFNNGASDGITLSNPSFLNNLRIVTLEGNANNGLRHLSAIYRHVLRVNGFVARNNGQYAFNVAGAGVPLLANGVTGNNGQGALSAVNEKLVLLNCVLPEANLVTLTTKDTYVCSHKHNKTADNHLLVTDGGTIASATDQRHTASGISWKFSPTSTDRHSRYPLRLPVARVACVSGQPVSVTVWTRRDSTSITGRLRLLGGQVAGVAADITVDCTPAINTWGQSGALNFTPAETGVVEIDFLVWDGVSITSTFWIDDLTVVS